MYAMGREADNVFKSFHLNTDNAERYNKVVENFDAHFIPKRNFIHERAKFYLRVQNNGESVDCGMFYQEPVCTGGKLRFQGNKK